MSGIPSWAVKGAKVVCINSNHAPGLVTNRVYTIASFDGEFVVLQEPETRVAVGGGRWFIQRFRPLVTRSIEQDIAEHFAHHLKTNMPAGVDA